MDGVLVDSEPQHIKSDLMTLGYFGVELEPEDLEGFTGLDNVLFFTRMKINHGIDATVVELIEMKNRLLIEELRRQTAPVPGLEEMTSKISRMTLMRAMASSSYRSVVDTVLEQLDLNTWFTVTVAGDEVSTAKPDPAIFLKTAGRLGVRPDECVVIEDSRNGVSSAIAAGMSVIGYRNPLSGNQDLSEARTVVDSLVELPKTVSDLFRLTVF